MNNSQNNLVPIRWLASTALIAGAVGWYGLSALAEGMQRISIDQIGKQPVLAECRVETKKPKKQEPVMFDGVAFPVATELPEDPLDHYSRGHNGEWQIYTNDSDEDPWVRLLVLAPGKPIVVDVAVTVHGQSFREARRRWVELLLSQARGNYAPAKNNDDRKNPIDSEPPPGTPGTDAASDQSDQKGLDTQSLSGQITEPVEGTVEQVKESDSEPVATAEQAAAPLAGVSIQKRKEPSVIKRLKSYVAAMGNDVGIEEIRWLLADWAGGPGLLVLRPADAWKRSEVAPLWSWFDEDQDHELSRTELKNVPSRLEAADFDEDGVIDLSELYRTEHMTSPYPLTHTHPLLVVLDEETDWNVLHDDVQDAYEANPLGGSLADLRDLLVAEADITLSVSLEPQGAVSLLSHGTATNSGSRSTVSKENLIVVNRSGPYLELSALYLEGNGETVSQPQVAIGAVVDGFPLVRLIDRNGDGRITRPEQRTIESQLRQLDTNQDGRLDLAEVPTAIRLSVANGPVIHDHLDRETVAIRNEETSPVELPDWFVGMDRNRDGELSRSEFPGSTKKFNEYDQDRNGVISGLEVQDKTSTGE